MTSCPPVLSLYLQHGSIGCFLLEDLLPAAAADPYGDTQQQEKSQEGVSFTVLMGLCKIQTRGTVIYLQWLGLTH